MAELLVVEELRDYLVAQGVVTPQDAPSLVLPSIWISPRDGYPQPRQNRENATVTLIDTLLAPAASLEAWIEEAFVDVVVVARVAPLAKMIQRSIRNLIHPNDAHGGRHQWVMNNLHVEYSTIWRGEQPLRQDDVAYSRTASYRIGCRRKALAGTPDLP